VPKNQIPADGLRVGTTLQARGPQGEEFPLRIHEIKDESVILDLNHPLAGKTLNFHVKVLDVQSGKAG
jgi:FKBP-type peptidyl-prolyl cis-trans isomerase SlyD